jgi:hypothetical protein
VDNDGPDLKRDVWMAVHEDLRRVPRVVAAMDFVSGAIMAGLDPAASIP